MLQFLIKALATLRLTILITEEYGPFSVSYNLRKRIAEVYESDPERWEWVYEGINCFWCVSFWAGICISTLCGRSPLYGMALSAFSMAVHEQFFNEED
jgi:hypothetical protein